MYLEGTPLSLPYFIPAPCLALSWVIFSTKNLFLSCLTTSVAPSMYFQSTFTFFVIPLIRSFIYLLCGCSYLSSPLEHKLSEYRACVWLIYHCNQHPVWHTEDILQILVEWVDKWTLPSPQTYFATVLATPTHCSSLFLCLQSSPQEDECSVVGVVGVAAVMIQRSWWKVTSHDPRGLGRGDTSRAPRKLMLSEANVPS